MTTQAQANESAIPLTTVPIHFDLSSSHRYVGDEDYRPTRRARTDFRGEAPAPWSAGQYVALIFACVLALLTVIGVAALIANGGSFTCDSTCMLAKKDMAIAHETTLRAMANSSANAQAGFGNNDDTTKQSAVAPPARIEYRSAPAAAAPPALAAPAAVAAPASNAPAGIASPAPEWGRCFINKDPNNKGYIGSDGLCYHAPHGTPADPRPHP